MSNKYSYGEDKGLADIDNELREALVGKVISWVRRSGDDELILEWYDGPEHGAITLGHSSWGVFVRGIR